ncbi:MAG: precorrin-3B C(17)-methyltransferase [Chloroflexota bacterium]|nr:MAG: precorrin-3B C(17)-methyltransferase [Chloroflexota bacterium]
MENEPPTAGTIFLVGLGPGAIEQLSAQARSVLERAEVVVGYTSYVKLIQSLLDGKDVVRTGMGDEVARARRAIELAAEGKIVAVVCSGDAGVYGMSGLIYELLKASGWTGDQSPEVVSVPGIPALIAAASLLGAPLMHDFAAISLSDLLTPWETIRRRLKAAAQGDFVIGLYNPSSRQRRNQIVEAREILLSCRDPRTPVGVVTKAYRPGQSIVIADLAHLLDVPIDMQSIVVVGNSTTFAFAGRMVTPRGYAGKYDLNG